MKVTIELEDDYEIKVHLKAKDMASFIFELQNNFFRKYKDIELSEDAEQIKSDLFALLDDYGIDANDFE